MTKRRLLFQAFLFFYFKFILIGLKQEKHTSWCTLRLVTKFAHSSCSLACCGFDITGQKLSFILIAVPSNSSGNLQLTTNGPVVLYAINFSLLK